jgi:hypothetical protein
MTLTLPTLVLDKFNTRSLQKKLVEVGKKNYDSDFESDNEGYCASAEDAYWYAKESKAANVLKTGKSLIKSGKMPVFSWDDSGYRDDWQTIDPETGIIRVLGYNLNEDVKAALRKKMPATELVEAVAVPYTKSQKYLLILNGDNEEESYAVPDYNGKPLANITISFQCLGRFYFDVDKNGDINSQEVAKLLQKQVKIIDFTQDTTVYLEDDDTLEIAQKWARDGRKGPCPVKPPAAGFTLMGNGTSSMNWHRSATVLFYDTKKKFSILIGQDEGTYFGVELADNPKTIAAAYKSLMPPAVRKLTGVPRQGEWFAVTVETPPAVEDCILEFDRDELGGDDDSYPCLNRDSAESAKHRILADEIRIGKDGIVYARNATLSHANGDHSDLVTHGWVAYHRNTAVRAFSVEGVD